MNREEATEMMSLHGLDWRRDEHVFSSLEWRWL